jgi:uncharacterized repeat protein (TIGR03803 family)
LLKCQDFRHAANHEYEKDEVGRCVRVGNWAGCGSDSSRVAASSSSTIYSFGTAEPIDGRVPKGSLTYVNGLLFGRTTSTIVAMPTPASTPIGSYGVIFHVDPNNVASSYSIDHVFAGGDADDGDNPRHDAMTPFNGLLYGTTLEGGTHNNGIIFSIGQDGTDYQVLLSLHNSIGDESHSCFVVANDILYGMTAAGATTARVSSSPLIPRQRLPQQRRLRLPRRISKSYSLSRVHHQRARNRMGASHWIPMGPPCMG